MLVIEEVPKLAFDSIQINLPVEKIIITYTNYGTEHITFTEDKHLIF